jgi:hypothetical protein
MPGMLGNRQDFDGNGELHPDWAAVVRENWEYYYAYFTDPWRNAGDPFYKLNTGVNYSSCPEMDCDPPEKVTAIINGFSSKTRIPHGFVVDFYNFRYDEYRNQDCYIYGSCDPFEEYTPSCFGLPDGIVFLYVAGRFTQGDAYDPCVILYDMDAIPGNTYPWNVLTSEICGWSGLWFQWAASASHPVLWPSIAFHNDIPLSCSISTAGFSKNLLSWDSLADEASSIPGYFQSNNDSNIKYNYPNFFNSDHIYDGTLLAGRNFTWSEVNANGILDNVLSPPSNEFCYYGPSQYNPDTYNIFFDDDHNGIYTCYRDIAPGKAADGLRPELIASINKTKNCCDNGGILISGVCCPEGSTGIFPENDSRAGRCCVDCSLESSEDGTSGSFSENCNPSVTDTAELIFEVGGREVWGLSEICCERDGYPEWISSFDFSTGEEIPPEAAQPDGLFYGVDYACGPRRAEYPYRNSEGELECNNCFRWYCDERLGMAEPHLAAYPYDHDNTTAQLKLILQPSLWMFIHGTPPIPPDFPYLNYLDKGNNDLRPSDPVQGLKDFDAVPYTWKVDSVDIISPGSGYTTDMYFYVDYDVNWFLPWIGGQIISVFPDIECCEPSCLLRENISWSDKYGYTKLQGNNVVYQRIKITDVGPSGEIRGLEVVPWFKSPEYKQPYIDEETGDQVWSFCENSSLISNTKDKTPYYVDYMRLLCHPNSVRHPGKNYSIGDIITWDFTPEQNTAKAAIYDKWNNQTAIGIVVDVDENGGILDWYISGSDRWKQYGVLNLVDGTPCYEYAEEMQYYTGSNDTLERDDRGRYRFLGYHLCSLTYTGRGNTVRACNITGVNLSTTTQLDLKILRRNCKTTATIVVDPWPFSDRAIARVDGGDFSEGELQEGSIGFYKKHFPPYPECKGGGVEIDIVYGDNLANDSVFGSTVKDAIVIASGINYAFKEKKHIQPVLPTGLPGGATLAYSFDSVLGFPHPNLLNNTNYNFGYNISNNRFAYFPVNGIQIITEGSGYSIGQQFEIKPSGGIGFNNPWTKTGGDDPDYNTNGYWYEGKNAKIDADGYMRYDQEASDNTIPFDTGQFVAQNSYLVIQIADTGNNGSIAAIDIINSGMMYKTIWTTGVVHPDTYPVLDSSLGYGAIAEASINTNINNPNFFGSVIDFWFRGADPDQDNFIDPYYPPEDRAKIPGNSTIGYGRDYASPENGYYWMLDNVNIGINGDVHLLAYYNWGLNYQAEYSRAPIHYLGENSTYQTYKKVAGSVPDFVPKSTVCSFTPCYSGLLNKSYPLYRDYYDLSQWSIFNCSATAQPFVNDPVYPGGPPNTSYGVLLRKERLFKDQSTITLQTKIYNEGDCIGDIVLVDPETAETVGPGTVSINAGGVSAGNQAIIDPNTPVEQDYYIIEYGMTLTLTSDNSTPGDFKHVNGRTVIGNRDGNSTTSNVPNS